MTEAAVQLRRPQDLESAAALADLSASLQDLLCTVETYPGICDALIEVKSRVKSLVAQRETVLSPLREQSARCVSGFGPLLRRIRRSRAF